MSPTPRINKYVDKQGRYPLTTLPNVLGGQLWLEIANPALAEELFLGRLVCFVVFLLLRWLIDLVFSWFTS